MTPSALQSLYECRHQSQEQWTLWAVAMQDAWPEMYRGLSAATALREPTEAMIVDGMEASVIGRPSIDDDSYVLSIWRAMYDAAPKSTPPPAIEVSPKLGEAMESALRELVACADWAQEIYVVDEPVTILSDLDAGACGTRFSEAWAAARALLAAPIALAVEQKSYWLLERGQLERQDPTLWLTGGDWQRSKPYFGAWTETAAKAKRFSDRESAEEYLRGVNIGCCHATEHIDLVSAGEQEHEK